jgi:hypothetical protein
LKSAANLAQIQELPIYKKFVEETHDLEDKRHFKEAEKFIKKVIEKNPERNPEDLESLVSYAADFVRFDAFLEVIGKLGDSEHENAQELVDLFREWELLEAKEMLKVAEGRIATIERLEKYISENAKEVPTIHSFLKEFPWVIDPRWTLVSDEIRYSDLLRKHFPESPELPEVDRRIDFLCVKEGDTIVVVEIKRPSLKASKDELDQVESYVSFIRDLIEQGSDPELSGKSVVGYLLVGGIVDTGPVRQKVKNLKNSQIYVRRYDELLAQVKKLHASFLERYKMIRNARRLG